jgi:hypothetical protein
MRSFLQRIFGSPETEREQSCEVDDAWGLNPQGGNVLPSHPNVAADLSPSKERVERYKHWLWLIRHPRGAVRADAIPHAVGIDCTGVDQALANLLADRDPRVREAALAAIRARNKVEQVRRMLEEEVETEYCMSAAEARAAMRLLR